MPRAPRSTVCGLLTVSLAGVIAGIAAGAGAAGAEPRVPGNAIRDRILERMEQRRLERVPQIYAATRAGAPAGYEAVNINGRIRVFKRYTPNRLLGSNRRVPVVFALHGAKGTADRLQAYLGLDAVAERDGFIVVYPEGEKHRWNDGRPPEVTGGNEFSTAADTAFINGLADALVTAGVADPNQMYLLGVSNGGFMGFTIACSGASRFAGFAAVIASMPADRLSTCKPGRPVPLVMINGTADSVIRFDGGPGRFGIRGNARPLAVAQHFAGLNGCADERSVELPDRAPKDRTRVTLTTWTGCDPKAGVSFYTVSGGGHQAPARSTVAGSRLLDILLGPRSRDLDTAEAVWAFFKGLRR